VTRTRPWSRYSHPERDEKRFAEPGGLPERPAELRLFVAIELTPALTAELAALQSRLRDAAPGLRWTRPEGTHCTLKFLGNLDATRAPAITRALSTVAPARYPRELALGKPGVFDGRQGPRVLWCGLTGDLGALADLAKAVDAAMTPLGFSPETRPFAPHLTLARFPDGWSPEQRRAAAAAALAVPPPRPLAMRPAAFSLMSSRLQRGGSVYSRVAEFPYAEGTET